MWNNSVGRLQYDHMHELIKTLLLAKDSIHLLFMWWKADKYYSLFPGWQKPKEKRPLVLSLVFSQIFNRKQRYAHSKLNVQTSWQSPMNQKWPVSNTFQLPPNCPEPSKVHASTHRWLATHWFWSVFQFFAPITAHLPTSEGWKAEVAHAILIYLPQKDGRLRLPVLYSFTYLTRMEGWGYLCYTHLPTSHGWKAETACIILVYLPCKDGRLRLPMLYSFIYLIGWKAETAYVIFILCSINTVHLNMNYNRMEINMMYMKEILQNICFSQRCMFNPCMITKALKCKSYTDASDKTVQITNGHQNSFLSRLNVFLKVGAYCLPIKKSH